MSLKEHSCSVFFLAFCPADSDFINLKFKFQIGQEQSEPVEQEEEEEKEESEEPEADETPVVKTPRGRGRKPAVSLGFYCDVVVTFSFSL